MTVDRRELHRRAQEILLDALDLEEDERLRRAREWCGGDAVLWREVRSLLTIAAGWGDDTTRSALGLARREPIPPPDRLDGFELVRPLGSGGMGTVGLYRQREPLDREVAIKLVQRGDDDARRRFLSECRILARLHHPAIAQVYEAGAAPDGRPFMVIEYVPGAPLSESCDAHELLLRARIRLLVSVCRAIDHAHQRAILHLDLKPANVLVMDQEGTLAPKVIDFGIGQRLDDEVSLTERLGDRLATPAWASPEQLQLSGTASVSVRSDVFTLGLLLYHELTASLPEWQNASSPGSQATDFPHAPSRYLASIDPAAGLDLARKRQTSVRRLQRAVSGDLDAIALKALRQDPEERYPSAAALAEDLERWLSGEPVSARPLHPVTRMLRTIRQNLALTLVAVGLLVSLTGGLLLVRDQASVARNQAAAARRQAQRAESVTATLIELFQQADPWRPSTDEPSARELVARAGERLLADETVDDSVRSTLLSALAEVDMDLGDLDSARRLLDEALRLAPGPPTGASDLETRVRAANLDHHQGRLEDAEARYLEALRHAERLLPESHLLRARIWNDFAYLQRGQGRHQEALEGFGNALEILPSESPLAGRAQDNLAGVLYSLGRYGEARAAYERALEIKRRALPPGHPDVAATISNLALVSAKMGRFQAAELAYRESLEIKLAHLDADHPEIGISWASLGNLFKAQARVDEAEEAYGRALEIYWQRLETHDYRIAIVRHGLGDLALLRSRHGDAIRFYRQALEGYSATLGDEHRLVAECLSDLGRAHLEAADLESAAEDLGASESRWRKILETTGSSRAATGLALTLLDLARLHELRGRERLARELREEAERIIPDDDALANRELRARSAYLLGRDGARELLDEVLATGSRTLRLIADARRAGVTAALHRALDEWITRGGSTLIFIDPYALDDRPPQNPQQPWAAYQHDPSSNLGKLLAKWGLELEANAIAADFDLGVKRMVSRQGGAERLVIDLQITEEDTAETLNAGHPVFQGLNNLRFFLAGSLLETGGDGDGDG
ncbi:MAG: tetratricopeptide repeat protein, partial [bacterium]|nr:tetratricopeptide repeat protein [bacterium]